jgi:hypothetical protein
VFNPSSLLDNSHYPLQLRLVESPDGVAASTTFLDNWELSTITPDGVREVHGQCPTSLLGTTNDDALVAMTRDQVAVFDLCFETTEFPPGAERELTLSIDNRSLTYTTAAEAIRLAVVAAPE